MTTPATPLTVASRIYDDEILKLKRERMKTFVEKAKISLENSALRKTIAERDTTIRTLIEISGRGR